MKEIVLTEKQLVDLIDEIEEKALLKFSSNQLQPLAWKAKIIKKAKKMSEKRKLFVFVQDQDSHWYRIDLSDKKAFLDLCEKSYDEDEFDEFEKRYGSKRIGCHPSNFEE